MKVRTIRVLAVVVAAALIGLTPVPAVATSKSAVSAQATGMRDLGTLGGANSRGADINVWGHVAGTSRTTDGYARAFRWTPSGGMQDLGALDIGGSSGVAINDLGQVIGVSYFADPDAVPGAPQQHAFRWTPAGGMADLGTLGGGSAEAAAINSRGQVVGSSYLPNGNRHAFLWTSSGGMRDLGTLGGPNSTATDINDLGQITGTADTAEGTSHAFRWTPSSGMQDLGTFGGPNSEGTAINLRGHVIGFSGARGSAGFVWTPSTGMQMLGFSPAAINALGHVIGDISGEEVQFGVRWTAAEGVQDFGLPDGVYSFARGMNDLGHVVGSAGAFERPYTPRAFLWTPAGGLRDLGTLGGAQSGASAINIRGHVTGTSETSVPGVSRAFVWTPDRRG